MSLAKPHHDAAEKYPWWPLTKRLLNIGFLVLMAVLLVLLAKRLDWQEVWDTLHAYRPGVIFLAAGATVLSYVVYSIFDLLGRAYTKHHLPARQVMPVTFACYAFNLNLSAWIGGIALRYRLYSRLGLGKGTITKVMTLSLMTNWLGYICLAGVIFSLRLVQLPPSWEMGPGGLQLLGVALLATTLTYLLLCAFSRRRSWSIRGHRIHLPSLKMALGQIVLGAANWALMALTVYILLLQKIDYPTVLGVLLISSIAGVITHIPAGLGVLEAVFIALLQHEISKGSLLAGLISYRIIYFLAPLLIATLIYLTLEAKAKKMRLKHSLRRD